MSHTDNTASTASSVDGGDARGELEAIAAAAPVERYASSRQTFHHEASVAGVVLDAVPDGRVKRAGRWQRPAAPLPARARSAHAAVPEHLLRDVPQHVSDAARAVLDADVDPGDVAAEDAHPIADAVVAALVPFLAADVTASDAG